MRKISLLALGLIFLSLGCARVRVEGPKEPIKLDISMRLDIYQHVAKDIDDIENIVSGTNHKAAPNRNGSRLNMFVTAAYAQDGLSPEVEEAAINRKNRRPDLISWESKGVIGENKIGMVEIRNYADSNSSVEEVVKSENSDRMLIYDTIAKKNNITVEEVQKLYAKRLQDDASSGTPIEVMNESSGTYEWKIK